MCNSSCRLRLLSWCDRWRFLRGLRSQSRGAAAAAFVARRKRFCFLCSRSDRRSHSCNGLHSKEITTGHSEEDAAAAVIELFGGGMRHDIATRFRSFSSSEYDYPTRPTTTTTATTASTTKPASSIRCECTRATCHSTTRASKGASTSPSADSPSESGGRLAISRHVWSDLRSARQSHR